MIPPAERGQPLPAVERDTLILTASSIPRSFLLRNLHNPGSEELVLGMSFRLPNVFPASFVTKPRSSLTGGGDGGSQRPGGAEQGTYPWFLMSWVPHVYYRGKQEPVVTASLLVFAASSERYWHEEWFSGHAFQGGSAETQAPPEMLGIQVQTTAVKRISRYSKSHELYGSPVHLKGMFTLHCSLFSVQGHYGQEQTPRAGLNL